MLQNFKKFLKNKLKNRREYSCIKGNNKKKYKIVMQEYYIDDNANRYNVDGKHVILEPTQREIEVANMLGNLYGGEIRIIPRVNEPENIKTPDYIISNQKFDLKEITGNGKYVIAGNLKGKQQQAINFVIDITSSRLSKRQAIKQIKDIYKSKHYGWINRIILIKKSKFIKKYRR